MGQATRSSTLGTGSRKLNFLINDTRAHRRSRWSRRVSRFFFLFNSPRIFIQHRRLGCRVRWDIKRFYIPRVRIRSDFWASLKRCLQIGTSKCSLLSMQFTSNSLNYRSYNKIWSREILSQNKIEKEENIYYFFLYMLSHLNFYIILFVLIYWSWQKWWVNKKISVILWLCYRISTF